MMKMFAVVFSLFVAVLGSACGPEILEPRMEGSWWGFSTIARPGQPDADALQTVQVVVAGREARISAVCPNGDGDAVAVGLGESAKWTGSLACEPFQDFECQVVLTYNSLALSYSNDSLFLDGAGVGVACATETPFTMSFLGGRL